MYLCVQQIFTECPLGGWHCALYEEEKVTEDTVSNFTMLTAQPRIKTSTLVTQCDVVSAVMTAGAQDYGMAGSERRD